MSKNLKRVVLGMLALAFVVGSLSANAAMPLDPMKCHRNMQTCPNG